ncbi:MAG: F0F1 ATP synthase subunit gamma [Pseudomonadota bacterium]
MDTLEALSARLETTQDIQAIVRVMKSLSSVSIGQFDRAVAALHDYQRAVDLGLQAVLRGGDGLPAARPARGGRAVVVIGSDRGLCGRFNESIVDFARRELLADTAGPRPRLLVVGARAADRLAAAVREPDAVMTLPGSADGLAGAAQTILVRLDRWREEAGVADIRICYNRRRHAAHAVPKAERLLPLDPDWLQSLAERDWPSRALPMFTMEREALLSWLLRQQLFLGAYRALARSLASEHAARLAAMQAADRNIDERREELVARFRQRRQESITAELLDIVSGFEAAGGR